MLHDTCIMDAIECDINQASTSLMVNDIVIPTPVSIEAKWFSMLASFSIKITSVNLEQ